MFRLSAKTARASARIGDLDYAGDGFGPPGGAPLGAGFVYAVPVRTKPLAVPIALKHDGRHPPTNQVTTAPRRLSLGLYAGMPAISGERDPDRGFPGTDVDY